MQPTQDVKTIGLILPNTSNYFCHTLVDCYSQLFAKKGYQLITAVTNHDLKKEYEYISYFSSFVDGFLIISDAACFAEITDAFSSVPAVFINRKPKDCPYTAVMENDYTAVFQAILSLTHDVSDKIACICTKPDLSTTLEDVSAYQAAMNLSSAGFHEEWVHYVNADSYNVSEIVQNMTEKGCHAFFTCTQSLTEQFMDYIFTYNLKAKEPLILAGFSNSMNQNSLQKSIDMVTQPIDQLVDLSVQLLLYHMSHPDAEAKDYLIKGTLRKRALDRLRIGTTEN